MENFTKIHQGGVNLLFVLLLCFVSGSAWGQETVTVSQSSFSATSADNLNGDKNVSYTTAKGGGTSAPAINSNQIRLYQNSSGNGGGTITIKVASGCTLTSVTIGSSMATSVAYTVDEETTKSETQSLAASGQYTVSELSASSVTFYCMGTSSSSRLYVNYLSVTYQTSGKNDANISFENSTYTVNVGGTITVKATSDNPNTITYSTEADESVCTIDGSTGKIVAGDTPATVTIKADVSESDEYTAGTATCILQIIDPNAVTDELTTADFKATSTTYEAFSDVDKGNGIVYAGKTNNSNDAIGLRTNGSDCGIVVTTNEKGYLLKSISVEWKSTTERTIDVYGKTTAYSSAEDLFSTSKGSKLGSIVYGESTSLKFEDKYPYIGIRSSSGAFSVTKITLVWAKAGSFTIGEEKYATYYTEDAYIMPKGVQGGIITATDIQEKDDATGTLTVTYDYTEGKTVPAKTALLLNGESGTYLYEITTSEDSAPTDNKLHGADAVDSDGKTYIEGTDMKYYVLTYSQDKTDYGFYYAAAEGAAVTYQKPYAFLAVDFGANQSAQPVIGFSIDGNDGTSGINAATSGSVTKNDGKVYSVMGVCVGGSLSNLPKGIYIMDGKKIAVK